ncbi:MAG: STAS domain-containing protein [Chromatiales bacterium]|nr:STAS domain-containing protein [Chromatiales bacterium]
MSQGHICYASHDDHYVLKFTGEIRCQLGCTFDRFLDELFNQVKLAKIVLDLSEAEMIDSTCLGLLARVANKMRETTNQKTTIISTKADINQVLESIGFDQVFNISTQPLPPLEGETCLTINESDTSCMADTVLSAHRLLSEINEENREVFHDVIETLESELEKDAQSEK